MNVVDASVWVSLFVGSDAHHFESRRWFEEGVGRGATVVAPAIVLAEIAGAVARRTGRCSDGDAAVRLATRVPGIRLVNVNRHVGIHAASLASELRLRGADAVYVAVADLLEVPLVTWDDEQIGRAGGRVTAVRPTAD